MSVPLRRSWLAASVALAVGCAPSVSKDEPVAKSAATLALFAPDTANPDNSVLPYPIDLIKDPVTGLLNIPFSESDTPEQTAMKRGLRTLDGFAVGETLSTRFSGPIDLASAADSVMLIKAATGEQVPVTLKFDAAAGNTLYIQPNAPLEESTQYLAVVARTLKDAAGQPVAPDQIFVFASSREPLVDDKGYSRFGALSDADANGLETLRQGYAPLFEGLEAAGLPRMAVAVAWPFTTQTVHAPMAALAQLVGSGAEATWENRIAAKDHALIAAAGIPADYLCDVHTGRIRLVDLLGPQGTFVADAQTGDLVTGTAVADYILVTPNLDRDETGAPLECTTPWPADKIVVFAHGLGRCKNDVLALANGFAQAGWAVLAVDGPKAGSRTLGNLGDQDLDGCADQPETPEFIAAPGASTNPFAIRDHLREWALELVQIAAVAKNSPASLAGKSSGAAAAKLALVGHSWGGMAAALGRGEIADLDAFVLNASSAGLGEVFAPGIQEMVAAELAAAGVPVDVEPGKSMLAASVAESVSVFRWASEPGDPLYGATTETPVLVQVVTAGEAMEDAPLHAADTQQRLAAAAGVSTDETTFELSYDVSGAPAALCDDASGAVGALLMPCIADATSPRYPIALAKTAGLQRQAITFVSTAAAGSPVVCDPDPTQVCP